MANNPPPMNPSYVQDFGVPNQNSTDDQDVTTRQFAGAALAGGIAGTFIAGPVVGVVAASGAAIAATTKGTGGEVARASGDAVASVGDRLKKMDEKHHVVDKTKKGFARGAEEMKKIDAKHHVVDKTKKGIAKGAEELKKIDEKHHVVDKTKKGLAKGAVELKKINEKHHVVDKTKKSLSKAGVEFKKIDQKYHVVDKASKGIIRGCNWVSNQAKPKDKSMASP